MGNRRGEEKSTLYKKEKAGSIQFKLELMRTMGLRTEGNKDCLFIRSKASQRNMAKS